MCEHDHDIRLNLPILKFRNLERGVIDRNERKTPKDCSELSIKMVRLKKIKLLI